MNQKEYNEKYKLYDERHHFWRDKILTQMGLSINLFLTIGIAIVGYLATQNNDYLIFEFNFKSNKIIHIIYYCTTVLAFLSVVFGCIAVTSRLIDLRITSHIYKIRKKTFKKLKIKLKDDFPTDRADEHYTIYFKLMFKGFVGLKDNEYVDKVNIKNKFDEFRDITRQLGELTWRTHTYQIILLISSIIVYCVGFMIKLFFLVP